jgi:hypothetical protein
MIHRSAAVVCALLLGACGNGGPSGDAPASAATAAESVSTRAGELMTLARYDGYGDLRFGMDEQAFAAAWHGELVRLGEAGENCHYRTPRWVKTPSDFAFMFEGGRFVRYDVGTAKETAPGGGALGMSADRLRALYGTRLSEAPHKYVPGARVLRVAAPRGEGVLVFETDAQGRVVRWRAGLPPQVDYVEGCS